MSISSVRMYVNYCARKPQTYGLTAVWCRCMFEPIEAGNLQTKNWKGELIFYKAFIGTATCIIFELNCGSTHCIHCFHLSILPAAPSTPINCSPNIDKYDKQMECAAPFPLKATTQHTHSAKPPFCITHKRFLCHPSRNPVDISATHTTET